MCALTPEEKKEFLITRFEEHRHLLRGAITGMAAGDLTRALNVATEVRVLVHETGSQKPLLKSLTQNYLSLPITERFEDPPPTPPPGQHAITFFCPISANISKVDGKVIVGLKTDLDAPQYKPSTLGHWWDGVCMVLPGIGPVGRKDLILNLADKEAAHVDPRINEGYKRILGSQFIQFKLDGDDAPFNISRLVVGKSGVELLDCLDKNFSIPSSSLAKA